MTAPDQALIAALADAPATPGTGTDNTVRVGTVQTVTPLTVSLQGGQVVSPGVLLPGKLLVVGDVVVLIRQDNTWLCIGEVGNASAPLGTCVPGDPDWIIPTLLNGWTDFAFDWLGARYRKLCCGAVLIEGLVKGGAAGTTIFNLPSGYRPGNNILFATLANGASARLDVQVGGNVQWIAGGTNAYVDLNCTFWGNP